MSRVSVVEMKPIRDRVSDAEWQTRVDLAACYRLVARYGMTDLIYNHITARVPGEDGHILINPYGCVIHTHSRAGMAVSAMKCGLLPLTQTAMRFHGKVSYHPYEGPAIDLAERARLVRDLGQNDAMFLTNHGILACGRSVAEAF